MERPADDPTKVCSPPLAHAEESGKDKEECEHDVSEEENNASDGGEVDGEEDNGEGGRCVHVNDRSANAAGGFATNQTSTTKYTWWNFPFKNLYEQVSSSHSSAIRFVLCHWTVCILVMLVGRWSNSSGAWRTATSCWS
jgi:hypothetical protein